MKYKALAAAALAVAATGAWAQSDVGMATNNSYLEIGYMQLDMDNVSAKPSMVRINAGADVVSNLAIEGMLAVSADDDTDLQTINGVPVQARYKVNHAFGLYLKPHANITDNFEVYGRLGYYQAKATVSAQAVAPGVPSTSASRTEDGVTFGIGASYKLTKNVSLTIDHTRFKDSDAESAGLGLRYNF